MQAKVARRSFGEGGLPGAVTESFGWRATLQPVLPKCFGCARPRL